MRNFIARAVQQPAWRGAISHLLLCLITAAALVGASSCGRGAPDLIPHFADQMPNIMVPAPAEPSPRPSSPKVTSESVTGAGDGHSAEGIQGCQEAVLTRSSLDHLCCSMAVEPPASLTCETGWKKVATGCYLSFTSETGQLWSCGEESAHGRLEGFEVTESVPELRTSKVSEKFRLHATAYRLGLMTTEDYLHLQEHYLKRRDPACNFFLITALCQAGYCETQMPWYRAAQFDEYFEKEGWTMLTLDQLKAWFMTGVEFDSVLQKDGVTPERMGHVAVPVGLGAADRLHIAEGSFGTITHHIEEVSDSFVTSWQGGFRIFVKTP